MYFTQWYMYSIERNLHQTVKLELIKMFWFVNNRSTHCGILPHFCYDVSHKCVYKDTEISHSTVIWLISYFSGRSPNITPLKARARGTEFWSANSTKAKRVGCVSSPAIRTNLTSPTCLKNSSSWSAVVVWKELKSSAEVNYTIIH